MSNPKSTNTTLYISFLMKTMGISCFAVIIAGGIGAVILVFSGADPVDGYTALFKGAFGGLSNISRTLEKSTPLIFNGLAVAFAFKAGLFNIGVQGQLLFGALFAAVAGFIPLELPHMFHAPLALLTGALAGGFYSALKGALKAYTGAHEVITGIMLNYVAINFTDYFAAGPLRDSSAGNIIARTPLIRESAVIPSIGNLPLGFIIALGVAIVVWWFLKYTTIGFEIKTVGQNPQAARYAGIKVPRTILMTMAISGMLAGLGGAIETQSVVHRFQPGFNVGLGFDGITIALLGRVHPMGVIPASILVGAMRAGAGQMQFSAGVATEIIDVIQAVILFFVAADILARWILRSRDDAKERLKLTTGWGKVA
jgi:simple sugar transport system permease protein